MVNASDVPHERPTDVGSISEFFFRYPDKLVNGMWGEILLIIVFSVTFLSLSRYRVRRRFVAASFVAFVVSVFLMPLGATGTTEVTITALLLAVAAVMGGGDRGV